jgi:hypothetical protein
MKRKFEGNQYTAVGRYKIVKISFWSKVKRFFKKVFIALVILLVIYGICLTYNALNPSVIYTKAEVIKEVPIKAPILERIFKCESGGKHFDKNGQVLMRSNTNRTVDIGIAQINTVWFAKASELGLDLTKEEDNRAMAQWIYENRGTGDWSASKKCWQD